MRLLLCSLLLLFSLPCHAEGDLDDSWRHFAEVYSLIEQEFADPLDPGPAIYQGALPGMVRTLDPHSAFLDPKDYERLSEMQRSTEKGFGSVVSVLQGRVIVLQTLPDSPSSRAGLAAGDEIVAINGYRLAHLSIDQLTGLLGQTRQSKAELVVQKPGVVRPIPLTLVPQEMADSSVQRAFLLKPGIAYIKLANFEGSTAEDLWMAIERLGGERLDGLLLDMRGNPGGIIESAVKIASFFLDPGQSILWIESRHGPREEVKVPEGFEPYRFRLTVLIDEQSASAAELVAGALQDHDRAAIIGRPSFGKGIVQSVYTLAEETALALTTARYLTPSGRYIQRPFDDCETYALASCRQEDDEDEEFHTDAGRTVGSRGGIVPDQLVMPRGYSRFEAVMEQTNSFFEFAQQWLSGHRNVEDNFDVPAAMLDDFQLFLSQRRIRPGLSEWSATLDYIRSRLKQEIFNLRFGVAKGDEVEVWRSSEVRAALAALEKSGLGGG